MKKEKRIKYPIPKRMNNPITMEKQKQNKYRNKKVVIDGIKFDSKKEGDRYLQLRLMEDTDYIKDLELQKKFELIPKYEINGRKVRAMNYICDFYYFDILNNRYVVEDVKGMKTQVYKLKKKMFEYKYKIEIMET
jgi:hypothetical protein